MTRLMISPLLVCFFSTLLWAQADEKNLYRLENPSFEVRFPASMTLDTAPNPLPADYFAQAASNREGTSALVLLLPRGEVKDSKTSPWPILEAILQKIREGSGQQVRVEGAEAVFVAGLPGLRYALIETENPHPVQFCQLVLGPDRIVSQLYGAVTMDRRVPAEAMEFFNSLRRPNLKIPEAYRVEAEGISFELLAGFFPRIKDGMVEISHPQGHGILVGFEDLLKPKTSSDELSELAQFIQKSVLETGPSLVLAGPGPMQGGRGVVLREGGGDEAAHHKLLWFHGEIDGRIVLTADFDPQGAGKAKTACDLLIQTLKAQER